MHKVLIIDDDRDIRDAIAEMLELEGFAPEAAGDGLEALRRLRSGPQPSAILLDLMMPVMSGEELFGLLPSPLRTRCVVMTAGPAKQLAPGVPVLRKPFDMDRLVTTLRNICGAA